MFSKIEVLSKTNMRCSVCGSFTNVKVGYFIPIWTKVNSKDITNKIPICASCEAKRGTNLIEVGELRYLPSVYIDELVRFYVPYRKYLKKCIEGVGLLRTSGTLNVEHALLCIKSYEYWLSKEGGKGV